MKDKIYSKPEAFVMVRKEQELLLLRRGMKFNSRTNESELVKLILKSNPKLELQAYKLIMPEEDKKTFIKILEIASAGFPDTNVQRLSDRLRSLIH